MASMSGSQSLAATLGACDNSIKRELRGDSQSEELYPNRETRECSGHWVEVKPSALPSPFLVAYSAEMAATLGIDPAECESTAFARFFAGDLAAVPDADVRPWATPYAVSVFGQPIMSPDPFGRGRAYGDGRALSLGVVRTPAAGDWELQLKGAGTTPFSRNGDGRAVLRSSVREYLVSEAMHHMRVPTTRALCLVASSSEYIRRMWYAPGDRGRDHPPNTIVSERCAITCRAAPSFLRVGHVELHARRAARSEPGALDELEALVRHAIRREFTHIGSELPLRAQLLEVVRTFARRQAALAVAWLRVGYVQGNMNSDNCLLNGRTMDYGPFGFVERYDELWSPFTSDMERKFGFERQPLAAQVNVMTLARALVPLFDRAGGADAIDELQGIVQDEYGALLETELGEMRRAKLGLREWDDEARGTLWPQLQALMQRSAVDYTILWRQLANVRAADASAASSDGACEQLVRELTARALYKPLEQPLVDEWYAAGRQGSTRVLVFRLLACSSSLLPPTSPPLLLRPPVPGRPRFARLALALAPSTRGAAPPPATRPQVQVVPRLRAPAAARRPQRRRASVRDAPDLAQVRAARVDARRGLPRGRVRRLLRAQPTGQRNAARRPAARALRASESERASLRARARPRAVGHVPEPP
jgi:uncharacterized protein YdiU (UPF0061 family)